MSTHQTIIRAGQPWWRFDWKELAEYQDLLWLLVKRDLTAIFTNMAHFVPNFNKVQRTFVDTI